MSQLIAVHALKPGMVIIRVSQQNGPVVIKKSGLVSSEAMIQGLAEMGVQEVEIDPEQTVQIETAEQPKANGQSQTQALLRGQYDTRAHQLDSVMSEQFNRSVFLPTVQALPGFWHRNIRQIMTLIILSCGGLGLGFVSARLVPVLPQLVAQLSDAEPEPAIVPGNLPDTGEGLQQTETPSVAMVQRAEQPAETIPMAQDRNTPSSQGVDEVAVPREETTDSEITEDPQLTTDDTVHISRELLAKFNQAIDDLAEEKQKANEEGEYQAKESDLTVHDSIPRVDQLPVRLLTELPEMRFNAHMYASNPNDRWVRVNGRQLGEGDWIDDKVQIVNIESQQVVLLFKGEVFTMAALTDW
jgi:general secretion pathway protein B